MHIQSQRELLNSSRSCKCLCACVLNAFVRLLCCAAMWSPWPSLLLCRQCAAVTTHAMALLQGEEVGSTVHPPVSYQLTIHTHICLIIQNNILHIA